MSLAERATRVGALVMWLDHMAGLRRGSVSLLLLGRGEHSAVGAHVADPKAVTRAVGIINRIWREMAGHVSVVDSANSFAARVVALASPLMLQIELEILDGLEAEVSSGRAIAGAAALEAVWRAT